MRKMGLGYDVVHSSTPSFLPILELFDLAFHIAYHYILVLVVLLQPISGNGGSKEKENVV